MANSTGHLAPLMIELDPTGKVVHSWGDPNLIEGTVAGLRNGPIQFRLHTCHFDPDNNVWIASSPGGMIQKYTHDGSRLLQQIGRKGGESVRASRGPEFYSQIGHKGGQKVRELIEQGKRMAREQKERLALDEMGNLKKSEE